MSVPAQRRIDENLVADEGGAVICRHCDTVVGHMDDEEYLARALRRVRPPSAAGPQVREDAPLFVDRSVVMQQLVCPSCATALLTEVVPEDDPTYRTKRLARSDGRAR